MKYTSSQLRRIGRDKGVWRGSSSGRSGNEGEDEGTRNDGVAVRKLFGG